MNPDWLLKHFEQISEAPDAVPRLRRFILDLAVRGKLVEQNPEDEPAVELLKHIQLEKQQILARGRAQNQDLSSIEEREIPFVIPTNWTWVRLGEVIKLWNGFAFKSSDYKQQGVPVIRIGDLQNGQVVLDSVVFVDENVAASIDESVWVPENALLIAMSGATTGKVAFNRTGKRLLLNQRVGRVQVFSVHHDFLRFFFETIVQQNLSISFGTAIPNLSTKQIYETAFPLPPLAEQHRIVAKVDELMALCDDLEAAQAKRERRRDRLVAATLHGVNNGDVSPEPDARPTFEGSARFYFNHLPRLTTRPEHIHQLRQTILNLAIRGRLVPQDPNDEPASALLKRIELEKQNLIKEGKFKKQEALEPCDKTIIPFDISTGWEWEKAGTLFLNVTDGFHNTPKPTDDGHRYLTAKHIRPGKIDFESCLYVDEKNHKELFAKTRVKRGDILIVNIGAGCGNPAIVEVDFEFSFKNVAILNLPNELDRDYILAFLLHYRTIVFDELIKGGAQPFLGLNMLRQMLIPVPPLAEQRRIVGKVDELMALCDKLDARITSTAATRHQLLEATLVEALSGHCELQQEQPHAS